MSKIEISICVMIFTAIASKWTWMSWTNNYLWWQLENLQHTQPLIIACSDRLNFLINLALNLPFNQPRIYNDLVQRVPFAIRACFYFGRGYAIIVISAGVMDLIALCWIGVLNGKSVWYEHFKSRTRVSQDLKRALEVWSQERSSHFGWWLLSALQLGIFYQCNVFLFCWARGSSGLSHGSTEAFVTLHFGRGSTLVPVLIRCLFQKRKGITHGINQSDTTSGGNTLARIC